MKKYAQALELIKEFEGLKDGDTRTPRLDPYLDPVGIWTIGWGHALTDRNGFIKGKARKADAYAVFPGGITRAYAERLLQRDMRVAIKAVRELVTVPLTNAQLNALASWTFNLGRSALARSALLRELNAKHYEVIPREMRRWVFAGGKRLAGLVHRRNREAALFVA